MLETEKKIIREKIQIKANQLLDLYARDGLKFDTVLYDTDYKEIVEEKKILLFFKHKELKREFSDEFAKTVVEFDRLKFYSDLFRKYLDKEKQTKTGFLIFERKRETNPQVISEAKFYTLLTDMALKVFLEKKDTPEFRENVFKMNSIFSKDVKVLADGDYGVIFTYNIASRPVFLPEDLQFLQDFSNELVNSDFVIKSSDEVNVKNNKKSNLKDNENNPSQNIKTK